MAIDGFSYLNNFTGKLMTNAKWLNNLAVVRVYNAVSMVQMQNGTTDTQTHDL